MGAFDTFSLLKWMHFVAISVIGGGAIVALLLSGFEEDREDLRGLAAAIWKRTVVWGARLGVLLGLGLLLLRWKQGLNPFDAYYLHVKLTLVALLLVASEMAPRHLAQGKRGAALLALLAFLLASFTVFSKDVFGFKARPVAPAPSVVLTPGS
jgi:uncharacterized membrane protein